ncbi:hypothetical protein CspHIS471_0511070 [Cutaneotrichosporon sp. HIS471]|nr:hypothetical protein CspHIS471_0511070 [Cutaneotrichosporon sp. HIS471]
MAQPRQLSIDECDAAVTRKGSPFEMEAIMHNGVEEKFWIHGMKTMREMILDGLPKGGDQIMVNAPVPEPGPKEHRIDTTFKQVWDRSCILAVWLRGHGVRKGSFVGLIGYNSVEWIVSSCAIQLLGAVPVMVNAALQAEPFTHCLNITNPVVVLCDAVSAVMFGKIQGQLKNVGPAFSFNETAWLDRHCPVPVIDLSALMANKEDVEGIKSGEGLGLHDLGPESDGVIFFTSGTTGFPKAVLSNQRAALHNLHSAKFMMARAAMRMGLPADMAIEFAMTPPEKQSVGLLCIPLFHATAGEGWLQKIIHFNQKLVLLRRWNVDDAVKACVDYGCGVIGGVPAVVVALIQHPDLPPSHKFESTLNGGAASPARLANDLRSRWPDMSIAVGWGMTETNALTTAIVGDDYVAKPNSAGWPLPIVDIKIVDPVTKVELPRNTVGLILSRGPNNMTCYYNNPKATSETLVDGYVDTGDAGYLDSDGVMFISDRLKDIIIRGGENIASEEIENAIYVDDRVAEAAAVPVPDDMLGELVAVAVSLRPGCTATAAQIREAVHSRVRPHARPAFVWVSDQVLPRNVNGKLVKAEIKKIVGELYASHLERAKM